MAISALDYQPEHNWKERARRDHKRITELAAEGKTVDEIVELVAKDYQPYLRQIIQESAEFTVSLNTQPFNAHFSDTGSLDLSSQIRALKNQLYTLVQSVETREDAQTLKMEILAPISELNRKFNLKTYEKKRPRLQAGPTY